MDSYAQGPSPLKVHPKIQVQVQGHGPWARAARYGRAARVWSIEFLLDQYNVN